jgi:tetratricopeptide (TPR) repeat protein
MSFTRVVKRFVGGIVLCVVAVWCFNEVRMPFTGNVPWSSGNTIWVIVLAIVGILALIWAYNLFISTIRMTSQANKPPTPSSDPQPLTKEEQEQYIQALQAVNANPRSFEAWTDLGTIEHKISKNDDALASANKAIEIISEDKYLGRENRKKAFSRAWTMRGAALSTMEGREDDALVACDEALANDQNNVDALYYKGRVLVFQERDNEAHEMFDRVIDLKPRYKDALVMKGMLYLSLDNFDVEKFHGALAVADRLILAYPDDASGWRMQGSAYHLMAENEGREENLQKAKELLDRAMSSFNQALEIDPTNGQSWLLKPSVFATMGNYSQALEAVNQGLKVNPSNPRLQELKKDIVGKRTKETASKIAGTAGRMALGGGLGLAKGSFRVGKMFKDEIFKS